MFVAAMIAYYLTAFALLYAGLYYTFRQNERRAQERHDRYLAELEKEFGKTPEPPRPAPRPEPEPVPDPPPPPELRVTIARGAGADGDRLPRVAADVIRQASRLEESFGGDGLEYDPRGSVEEPGRLVLRLVPRSADWAAADRLAAVAEELNQLAGRARDADPADLRARIARELRPRLPPEVERVDVAAAG